MKKFSEAIQAYNVTISFVMGVHNHISDELSLCPVEGGADGVERVLKRLRGHASYVYNRVVSYVNGDIHRELIEVPALDDIWEAVRLDKGYQSVALTMK